MTRQVAQFLVVVYRVSPELSEQLVTSLPQCSKSLHQLKTSYTARMNRANPQSKHFHMSNPVINYEQLINIRSTHLHVWI